MRLRIKSLAKQTLILIAGGFSCASYDLDEVDLRSRGTVMGVNGAALVAKCDYALTMDRLFYEAKTLELHDRGIPLYYRKCIVKGVLPPPSAIPFKGTNKPEMTDDLGVLGGTNSGACALNWAYKHKAAAVYLFGYDMQKGPNGEAHWYAPYPWRPNGATTTGKFAQWEREFTTIARQFREIRMPVFNVNHNSALRCFPTIKFDQFLRETGK